MWNIDEKGWICGDAGVICMPRTFVERGTLSYVKGVIVHQTVCATVEAALNSYQRSDAKVAHFLIGRDGRTYQLASLFQKIRHVRKFQAQCVASHSCSAAEFISIRGLGYQAARGHEMRQAESTRFPSTEHSLGIDLVARCILDPKLIQPGMGLDEIERLTADRGVFETVPRAQNALKRLIRHIQDNLHVPESEGYPHPQRSMNNLIEVSPARWPGKK